MSEFFPLLNRTHFSLLRGLSRPQQLAGGLVARGYPGAALADAGSVSGAAAFVSAMKSTCLCGHAKRQHPLGGCSVTNCGCGCFEAAKLRPVLGCEFRLAARDASDRSPENSFTTGAAVFAKGDRGWRNLVRAVSASNRSDFFFKTARLDLDRLASYGGGEFVCLSGHAGSDLAACFFADPLAAYSACTYQQARSLLADDWRERAVALAGRYRELFGKDNFFLAVQLNDRDNCPASQVVAHGLRIVSKKTNAPCVAAPDCHYLDRADAEDHRVLLCSGSEATLAELPARLLRRGDPALLPFGRSKRYHLAEPADLNAYEPGEAARSLEVAAMCGDYDILRPPILPQFDCPEGVTPEGHLRSLCEAGWLKKLAPRAVDGSIQTEKADTLGGPGERASIPEAEYRRRLEAELGVLSSAGLAPYFLVVQDYVNYARSRGRVGRGRGSGAGCLVSYLSGITDVDPVAYGLVFERFYNAGRNSPGKIALPDIDSDFEKYKRDDVIRHVRSKYGEARVGQLATFARVQGRGAVKDVLRAHAACDFAEMNRVTAPIPQDASVSDQLQEMLQETGEASVIRWALEHEAKGLSEWVRLEEGGPLSGQFARHFAQAMRLEGTFRSMGRHPSGVVISPLDLADLVPLARDQSSGELYVGLDMRDAEAMGLCKFDILGLSTLDRLRGVSEIVRTGRLKT